MMLSLKDSRGKESKTLFLVSVSWAVLVLKFLVASMTLPVLGDVPAMSAGEFGLATGAVLAIWLGREHTEKKNNDH